MRRILLIGHPRRPEAVEVAIQLVAELAQHGILVVGSPEELHAFGVADCDNVILADPQEAAPSCELAVVLGGDGTILRAAEIVRDAGVPLLGINLGHVGFLAEAERDSIHHTVEMIAARDWTVERRATVDIEVWQSEQVVWTSWALNEASIEKAARERMLEMTVEIDGRPLSTWGCDGVVIATPTGSTAYAFSGGGPVVWPDVEALLVVPLSAHALFARPLVLGPSALVALDIVPNTLGHGIVWADGRRAFDLPPGSRVQVRRSPVPVLLARLSQAPFVDRLVAKFDLSVSGWRGNGPARGCS